MIHTLSKIFMEYGDSNWTIGILIGLLIVIAGVILCIIGMATEMYPDARTVLGMIVIIVGIFIILPPIIGCTYDNEQNAQTVIRKEYEDASFDKKDNKFISNNITYGYDIKDRKIIVYPLVDNVNIKIIE